MELTDVWFVAIAALWTGYFFLEGFDFGVGIWLPVLGRDDTRRRVLINTIGPVWDGNEVWLIVAVGATFAAFPDWYAALLSSFYLPLLVILVCLILRGVAFEYRAKGEGERWRRGWDRCIVAGSVVPAFMWGLIFGNVVRGIPLSADGEFAGSHLDLINGYSVLGGLVTLSLFALHGAVFLGLKTLGEVRADARRLAAGVGVVAAVLLAGFAVWSYSVWSSAGRWSPVVALLLAGSVAAVAGGVLLVRRAREGLAFAATGLAVVALVASWFVGLHPAVLPSTLDPAGTLTVSGAAASPYTLTVISWMSLGLVPFVVAYQAWSYWVFRRRIGSHHIPAARPQPTGER